MGIVKIKITFVFFMSLTFFSSASQMVIRVPLKDNINAKPKTDIVEELDSPPVPEEPAIVMNYDGVSCVDILNKNPAAKNNNYIIDVDGYAGPENGRSAYCLMSQGGWMLYDSFGTVTGNLGTSPNAYGYKGINSKTGLLSSGYLVNITNSSAFNNPSYHNEARYLQFYGPSSSTGMIEKTMPGWVSEIKADVSNSWYKNPGATVSFGGQSIGAMSGYSGHSEFIIRGNGNIRVYESVGIIWLDALWVK